MGNILRIWIGVRIRIRCTGTGKETQGLASLHSDCVDGYDTRRNEYTFTGFQRIAAVIRFENAIVCDCPTRPIGFEIFNNDTINVINANGLKQGVWISFFDTCEKEMEMYYDKGVFTGGKLFDKKGNDRHATFIYRETMEISVKDSLQEK
jgi:hypothetical protein